MLYPTVTVGEENLDGVASQQTNSQWVYVHLVHELPMWEQSIQEVVAISGEHLEQFRETMDISYTLLNLLTQMLDVEQDRNALVFVVFWSCV